MRFTKVESGDGKRIFIYGPISLTIEIDNDDVNHEEVKRDTYKLLRMLEKYWYDTVDI